MTSLKPCSLPRYRQPLAAATLVTFAALAGYSPQAAAELDVAQQPLFSLQNVPGSLVLTPSVEWPTINSVANLGGYSEASEYAGYFDPNKCYQYSYDVDESQRHFFPVSQTSNRRCTSSGAPWSGNFLNWAATQTVDPFRSALTGGYRVRDTPTETWLEKARHTGQGGTNIYPNRRLPDSGTDGNVLAGATPFGAYGWMRMRIEGLGNQMRFRLQNNGVNHNVTAYNPTETVTGDHAYEVSVRVRVCVSGLLEGNCQQYANGWKPEGTLQEYSDRIRYSLFGYVNDHSRLRDGGVLRAKQKYIGPMKPDGDGGMTNNPRAEWDENTGVLTRNPDSDWASETGASIQDSGVINYLNKFGQMTTRPHKSTDPVSELYYAGLRYLKNQGNVSSYSSLTSLEDPGWSAYEVADGFPVITDWDDPVEHWCQPNTILGIGDIYTHRDKNLPGSSCSRDEPSTPAEVSSDNTVNVVTETNRVGQMEGIGNIGNTCNFTGRENSAYMAGLAWHANAHDIRPDLDGGRTSASTYWVDVLEAQSLEGMSRNQFALAAKYGGARLPQDFDADDWGTTPLPDDWWHRNGETLTPFGQGGGQASFMRPDNFFTAGEANSMVESLERAFEAISLELAGTSTAAAASSAILQSDTLLYTAGFRSEDWSGTLTGRPLDQDGNVAAPGCPECWDAETALASQAAGDNRRIFTRSAAVGQISGAGGGVEFRANNLHADQREALDYSSDGDNDNRGDDRVAWLRGQEQDGLRSRIGSGAPRLLGDIINSDPVFVDGVLFVGANDGMLHAFDGDTGEELFAYIPSKLLLPEGGEDFAPLSRLTALDYNRHHRYFVDGKLAVREVHDGTNLRTVLVGSLGAGGRQVFALDVSDPANFSPSDDVLWEFSHDELGTSIGTPQIARTRPDGDWAAFFGNGYNSASQESRLFAVDLFDGSLTASVSTGEGDVDAPNGLAAPFITDWPGVDLRANRAYAGDLLGNLWVFDLTNINSPSVRLLARATAPNGTAQPITTRPIGQILDQGRAMISFGTGSYIFEPDADDSQIQSLYGVVDSISPPSEPADRSDLFRQRIEFQETVQTASGPQEVRVLSDDPVDLTEYRGWIIDLDRDSRERVISGPVTLGREEQRVRFSTLIPDEDPCGSGRRGFFMDFDLRTGGQLQQPVFDLDRDGVFGDSDRVLVNGELQAPSGISVGTGERIITIQRPETASTPSTDRTQLACDGEGNCEIVRDDDQQLGRMNWQQLR
ncbi:pilus assembly protein [Thioalkalivibrio sp. ALJ7]|uniref:pilus assembly protein n=1 Tax=Thioalkalivibrio sp. ALJ7 TaxID=1158756 RepID=UPI00039C3180|nr:PilC/PilY family type IV pilus protein [Thioalkalivibrio sp. ALJ7]